MRKHRLVTFAVLAFLLAAPGCKTVGRVVLGGLALGAAIALEANDDEGCEIPPAPTAVLDDAR